MTKHAPGPASRGNKVSAGARTPRSGSDLHPPSVPTRAVSVAAPAENLRGIEPDSRLPSRLGDV